VCVCVCVCVCVVCVVCALVPRARDLQLVPNEANVLYSLCSTKPMSFTACAQRSQCSLQLVLNEANVLYSLCSTKPMSFTACAQRSQCPLQLVLNEAKLLVVNVNKLAVLKISEYEKIVGCYVNTDVVNSA
jgi:hypothetical protein